MAPELATVVQVTQLGGPELLSLEKVEVPEPEAGEVRFRVAAFALNRADILYINGEHYTALKLPSRVGSEACGIVDAVGPGVTAWRVGDRVSSVPHFTLHSERYGVQGEVALMPEKYLAPWPEGFSAEEACSTWMQYLTAYYALTTVGGLKPGGWALLPAGASSAGGGAVQVAKALGAHPVSTTRAADKVPYITSLGAEAVVVTSGERDISEELRQITGGAGINVVFDPIGGSFTRSYFDGLAWGGKVLVYGLLAGDLEFTVPILPAVRHMVSVHPYSLFNHVMETQELQDGVVWVLEQIRAGRLRPTIDSITPFDRTIDAYRRMLSGRQQGKIVVSVAPVESLAR
jgi:NADPH:quinone reductase